MGNLQPSVTFQEAGPLTAIVMKSSNPSGVHSLVRGALVRSEVVRLVEVAKYWSIGSGLGHYKTSTIMSGYRLNYKQC